MDVELVSTLQELQKYPGKRKPSLPVEGLGFLSRISQGETESATSVREGTYSLHGWRFFVKYLGFLDFAKILRLDFLGLETDGHALEFF